LTRIISNDFDLTLIVEGHESNHYLAGRMQHASTATHIQQTLWKRKEVLQISFI